MKNNDPVSKFIIKNIFSIILFSLSSAKECSNDNMQDSIISSVFSWLTTRFIAAIMLMINTISL
jgi:hypothetical protein